MLTSAYQQEKVKIVSSVESIGKRCHLRKPERRENFEERGSSVLRADW
jgi:hypothetical protein